MKKSQTWLRRLLTAAAIVWCIVIWQFSASPASDSATVSDGVTAFCNRVLRDMGFTFQFTHIMVRKIAHFTEFFVLGALASSALLAGNIRRPALFAVLACLWVAAVDECIQVLAPGRGPAFADVILDTCGGVFGTVLFFAAVCGVSLLCEKKSKKSKKISKTP